MNVRRRQLDEGLDEVGAEGLLIVAESSRDPDLAAFTGPAHLGESFLVAARGREPVLGYLVDMERDEAASTGLELAPVADAVSRARRDGASDEDIWVEVLAAALSAADLEGAVLALAGHPPAGRAYSVVQGLESRGFGFVSGNELVRAYRKTKSQAQLESVRRAAAGTCLAFRRVAEILANADRTGRDGGLGWAGRPLLAGDLRREVAVVLARQGLEQPHGNIVAAGGEAGVPHTRGSDSKPLRAGEAILVDLYPRGELYADCTRTFCVGAPNGDLERAHERCRLVLEETRMRAVGGAVGADLQAHACDLFEAAGFATARSTPGTRTGYVHGLGHGVGYELHEYPTFRRAPGSLGVMTAGDVLTLEPGLYAPDDGFGVRIEDLFVIHDSGAENLTPLPYDLDPRVW